MDCKQERQRRDRLLSARQLLHVTKALHGGHGVVLQTSQVRLLLVIQAQERGSPERVLAALRQVLFFRVSRQKQRQRRGVYACVLGGDGGGRK